MVQEQDRDYVKRLGEVLSQRDPGALRAFLEASAARFGDRRQVETVRSKADEEMVELMHRMILARQDLAHLHSESRRALETRRPRPQPTRRLEGKR